MLNFTWKNAHINTLDMTNIPLLVETEQPFIRQIQAQLCRTLMMFKQVTANDITKELQ